MCSPRVTSGTCIGALKAWPTSLTSYGQLAIGSNSTWLKQRLLTFKFPFKSSFSHHHHLACHSRIWSWMALHSQILATFKCCRYSLHKSIKIWPFLFHHTVKALNKALIFPYCSYWNVLLSTHMQFCLTHRHPAYGCKGHFPIPSPWLSILYFHSTNDSLFSLSLQI